ncbi:hypothetical protein [Bacteroides sp. 51]|uniref:hypothetical protein n=1 Tax=Bacteroides sp. 51 TaxID=2302938 RepID=UPI0013D4E168|nr:hypothetical protein [Bacteroides sp. 51]NDV84838.1 hypothetical protein [Bacteroides sp. 51]
MRYITIVLLLFCILSAKAQEYVEGEFILPDDKSRELNIDRTQNGLNTPIGTGFISYYPNSLLTPSYKQSNIDFNGNIYDLKYNLSYLLYNNTNVLNGFGSSYEVGGMLVYHPFDKLTFSIGASGAKYTMNGNSYNDYLFNTSMTYRFNHWLKFHLYGQYSLNAQSNALAGGYYLSPQTSYGALLMIKVIDEKKYSVDMNIGAERTFNPLNKQWEMNYRLGPEIRIKCKYSVNPVFLCISIDYLSKTPKTFGVVS